jgi:uncharacterized protein with FMN-binding domain
MRRFIAVFVATVAGLVVLLSFKDSPVKAPPAVALSSATPGESSDPAVASSAPASSAATLPVSSDPASSAASSAAASTTPSAAPTTPTTKASPTASKSSAKATPKATATPKPSASSTTKTVTGSAVTAGERGRVFGTVQVRITLTNGKITAATAINYPNNDPRSSEISSYSIPVLSREVLQAQGSSIAVVSGATYTSEAYAQSVQAALDAAKA